MSIRTIVEKNDTTAGQAFDWIVQGLIFLSILVFSLKTLPDLANSVRVGLQSIEAVIVFLFTLEYFLRVWVAERKRDYIFSFYGLVDLIAIVPFYISLLYVSFGVDLQTLRILRMLHLFRIMKLLRYSRAIQRFSRALVIAKEEVVLFGVVTGILLYLSAVGIYYFEHQAQPEVFKSIFHSLWWAVATLTTVGYGDVYPITVGGRIFTFIILMIGLGIVAVPAGLLASALSEARIDDKEDEKNRAGGK